MKTEKAKECQRRFIETHPDYHKLYLREWRKKHPSYDKDWREKDPVRLDKIRKNQVICASKWKANNLEHWKQWRRNHTKETKDKYGFGAGTIQCYGFRLALTIYEKYQRQCFYCKSENDLTLHHLDHKGSNYKKKGLKPNNNPENLILLCRACHSRIHATGKHPSMETKQKMSEARRKYLKRVINT